MDDEQAAKLRALAERALNAEQERADAAMRGDIDGIRLANNARLAFRAAASPDVLLALLDERDAAMALLRRIRDMGAAADGGYWRDEIDALLGGGGGK